MVACNVNSSQNKFLLAERLHEDKKYEAAINEYQDVVNKEPYSELGIKALLKIAQTQHLYLGRMSEAQATYRLYLKRTKSKEDKQQITQILAKLAFEEFENYDEAIQLYRGLLADKPADAEAEEYDFQIGRALFFKNKFQEAAEAFEELKTKYPTGKYAIRADLESANAESARGHCREAIAHYQRVIAKKDAAITPRAIFEQANCYEELDDLDKAYELLDSIRETYPAPQVVALKMNKIKRRKILRKR